MDRDQFLQERMLGIGGSDAAAVLGLSERKTALDVFLEKRGQKLDEPETDDQLFGRLLEPVVRDEYARRTNRVVEHGPHLKLRHERHPFIIGHPDGLVKSERLGYEGKTARTDRGWGEPGTDQIPQEYLIQVQHYLLITGYVAWDVAVLIGGQGFRIYHVEPDLELHEMIIEAEADFWARVERGDAPAPDWKSPHTLSAIRRLFPGTNGETIPATACTTTGAR
jgi:putative phage-type endonuclease